MTFSDSSSQQPDDPDPIVADAAEPLPPRESCGRMIRVARERAQLSLEELAGQTKLTRTVLQALEDDDLEGVVEPVYVRGYYRKCAKVLGLPADELVRVYDSQAHPGSQRKPAKLLLAGESSQLAAGGGHAHRRGIGWLSVIILIAIVVAIAWYANRYRTEHATASTQKTEIEVGQPIGTKSGNETPATSNNTDATASSHVADTASGLNTATSGAHNPPATQAPGGSNGSSAVTTAAASASTALTVNVSATSWVQVKDATGKLLFKGQMDAGRSQTLDGTPPYSVVLGNAPGVKLSYQGKQVPLSVATQPDSTARLSVPAAAQ